jgi:hypothetical protein
MVFGMMQFRDRIRMLLVGCLLVASAATAAPQGLDSLKPIYVERVKALEKVHEAKAKKLGEAYGAGLDRALETLKQQGEPRQAVAAINEIKRFDEEQTVPQVVVDSLPEAVVKVQARHIESRKLAESDRAKRLMKLAGSYSRALDRLMRKQTAAGELEQALRTKSEVDRIEFVVADLDAAMIASNKSVFGGNTCALCAGKGRTPQEIESPCTSCRGTGHKKALRSGASRNWSACMTCRGRGVLTKKEMGPCPNCSGTCPKPASSPSANGNTDADKATAGQGDSK